MPSAADNVRFGDKPTVPRYKARETDMKKLRPINSDRLHIRAIRDEIGERLRLILRAPSQLSLRLLTLMKRLTKADR